MFTLFGCQSADAIPSANCGTALTLSNPRCSVRYTEISRFLNGLPTPCALGSMIKPTKKMHRFFVWRPGDTVYTMLPYVMHLLGHARLPRGAAGWRHVVARHSTTQHVVPWRATRSSSQHDGATHCASGIDQSSTHI